VNVESPITDTAGYNPASAAPFAMVIEAPMSTQELIAWNGGRQKAARDAKKKKK